MNLFKESFRQLLGSDPRKPRSDELSPKVKEFYVYKKSITVTKAKLNALHDEHHATSKNKMA